MRRVVWSLALVALVLGGCTRGEPEAAPTPTVTESPSPEPEPVFQPLTGIEVDGELPDHPIAAVKIDNAPAAVPQTGLDAADVVFEEEVEGGLTRFAALYFSQDPDEIGPVRSAREADAVLLPQYGPVVGVSGAARPVVRLLERAGLKVFEEGQDEAEQIFFRISERRAPQNLHLNLEELRKAGDGLEPPDEPVWTFEEDTPSGGVQTASVDLRWSVFHAAGWEWGRGAWQRIQNGSPHETADGDRLTTDNVVIMRVDTSEGSRRDSAGNPTVDLELTGRGEMTVLRDGESFTGTWRKASEEARLRFVVDGEDFPLKPGRTWIEMIATDANVTLETVDADATEDAGDDENAGDAGDDEDEEG